MNPVPQIPHISTLMPPAPPVPQIPYIPAGPVGEPAPRPMKPATPELDKRHVLIESDAHKGVVAFLEWLDSTTTDDNGGLRDGYVLARFEYGEYMHVYENEYEGVLAKFYGLDLEKIASEQDALLAYLRELNQQ